MVQFHEHIISDLLEEEESNSKNNGGLVILSTGLSLHKLIASLLTLHSPPQGTLLILNSTPSQRSSITQSLELQNHPDLPSEITSELSQNHRHSLYASSSAFFITSRILIVDLLNDKVPTSLIEGIIILNAHNLNETCTESFIVRIFRGLNKVSYVRAFSDKPNGMVAGFGKTERIMKCLFMRRLHLWPRFQVYVSQDLEKDPPVVVDVRVGMSGLMKGIQKAVIEAMDACLKELKKTNKVDVDDLTVENGLFKSFDEIVRRQLDPIWHVLGKKTKQLVMDLKTLRKLLDYLVRYDAVTYLKYLDTLRVSEGVRSIWILADSSHKIFEYAKKRVYHLVQANGEKLTVPNKSVGNKKKKAKEDNSSEKEVTNMSSGAVIEEVLEEAPKWKVLREILEEIEEERQKQALPLEGEHIVDNAEDDSGIVLVACKDERSCMQLEDLVMKGPRQVMRDEWEKYLRDKTGLHGLQTRKGKKPKHNPKGFGILALLVMHFPRLRLVWSRNLHATAEIFASLKANQDEPDVEKAMRVGVPSEEGIVADDVRAATYNTSAIEFLRRLPGVTDSNYRALIDGCKSLAELALLPIDKLAELMGGFVDLSKVNLSEQDNDTSIRLMTILKILREKDPSCYQHCHLVKQGEHPREGLLLLVNLIEDQIAGSSSYVDWMLQIHRQVQQTA